MKKLLALLMVLAIVFACAACGGTETTESKPTDSTDNGPESQVTQPPVTLTEPANYLQISMSDASGAYVSLTAYEDGTGEAFVEYVGEVKKVGTFPLSVLVDITAALESSGLAALNGQSVYGEGENYASMYVAFADGSYLACDYSGTVAQEFLDGYEKLDAYFQTLTADLDVYVPRPVVAGEVNEAALNAMLAVLEASGMENLDMFSISDVPMDEFFTMTMGLSDSTGIVNGTSCGPLMMATAYSFVIATVENEDSIEAVRKDFAANLDWDRWVCVVASDALIAQKGNMVLCMMGSGDLYEKSAAGIEAAGWTALEAIRNPNQ